MKMLGNLSWIFITWQENKYTNVEHFCQAPGSGPGPFLPTIAWFLS